MRCTAHDLEISRLTACCDDAPNHEKNYSQQVLRAEKEVTLELRRLSNLDIYPVAELAHIRREHDSMAKEWRQVSPYTRRGRDMPRFLFPAPLFGTYHVFDGSFYLADKSSPMLHGLLICCKFTICSGFSRAVVVRRCLLFLRRSRKIPNSSNRTRMAGTATNKASSRRTLWVQQQLSFKLLCVRRYTSKSQAALIAYSCRV